MNTVLDIAFVVALVAFLKQQFGLAGSTVLIVAFIIALGFGLAPLIAGSFPAAAPYIQVILTTLTLFFGAAGSWDAVRSITRKQTK
jgi:hypothetical protein